MKKIVSFLLRHEILILILGCSVLLRLPSLIEPYWYGDEGIYLTLGNAIRHGEHLYKDIHDNKPPVIYFLAALTGSMFWFRFLLVGWNLLSIITFWWIAKQLVDQSHKTQEWRIAGVSFPIPHYSDIATLLFSIIPIFIEGNIANGEIFMILPILIGFALLIKWRQIKMSQRSLILPLLSGLSFAVAFLTKVPAAFDAIAAGLFFFILADVKKNPLQTYVRNIFRLPAWVYGIAFLLPIIGSVFYYNAIGAGGPYLNAALLQNVGYLASWKTGTQSSSNLPQSGLKNRAVVLGGATLVIVLMAATLPSEVVLTVLWFGFALFGALLSERPYPHYLIQLLAPFTLVLILLFQYGMKVVRKRSFSSMNGRQSFLAATALSVSLGVLIFSYVSIRFWNYPILPYYNHYIQFVTKNISKDAYLASFDPTLPEQYKLAELILASTNSNDRIFLWGDLPTIYALTRRLPPGRYTSAYHVKDFNGFDETYSALEKNKPKLIVIDTREKATFPKLYQLLAAEYAQRYSSEHFELYVYLPESNILP
jgi:hypothetical protein